jgi:hypothetical protein
MGAGNVEFLLGELEHLPIADNTTDVVSNCVIQSCPRQGTPALPMPSAASWMLKLYDGEEPRNNLHLP